VSPFPSSASLFPFFLSFFFTRFPLPLCPFYLPAEFFFSFRAIWFSGAWVESSLDVPHPLSWPHGGSGDELACSGRVVGLRSGQSDAWRFFLFFPPLSRFLFRVAHQAFCWHLPTFVPTLVLSRAMHLLGFRPLLFALSLTPSFSSPFLFQPFSNPRATETLRPVGFLPPLADPVPTSAPLNPFFHFPPANLPPRDWILREPCLPGST
jgi:hypothetical protein